MINKMTILRTNMRFIRNCDGCGLVHMIECSMEPRTIDSEETALRMLKHAIKAISNHECPECDKKAPTIRSYRSMNGSGSEWGM